MVHVFEQFVRLVGRVCADADAEQAPRVCVDQRRLRHRRELRDALFRATYNSMNSPAAAAQASGGSFGCAGTVTPAPRVSIPRISS